MTKEQTKNALTAAARACYYGATRKSRLTWCLTQAGIKLEDARELIRIMTRAHMLEEHLLWISATPFLCGVITAFDELTSDIDWPENGSYSNERGE